MNANATAVLDLLRNAYGLDASDFAADIDATPLSLYSFDGPTAQYASQFGLVAGGLPCARRGGGLRLQDPGNRPQAIPTFRNTEYAVLRATTDFDVEQLFNVLISEYPTAQALMADGADGELGDSSQYTGNSVSNQISFDRSTPFEVSLAVSPPANSTITDVRVTLTPTTNTRMNAPSIGGYMQFGGVAQGGGYSRVEVGAGIATAPTTTAAGSFSGGSLRATLSALPDPPVLRARSGTQDITTTGWATSTADWTGRSNADRGRVTRAFYGVSWEYTLTTQGGTSVRVVAAGDSVTDWDERTLEVPRWIAPTASASFQARIDELAEPRNIIVEDFAVRQPTAQRTTDVANIQPGDHVGLITSEPSDRVNINAVVMVMNVGYDLHRERQVSRKRLVCIEAGASVPDTFPPTFVSAATNAAGTEIVAVFSEALDDSSVPALSAFTILAGTTRRLGASRAISGNEITFTFTTAFAHDDVITIAYTKPGSDPLQDEAGNEVETFTAQPVANNVPAPVLPVAAAPSITIDAVAAGREGTTVTLGATGDGTTVFDTIEYAWTVSGGALDDATDAAPVWTRPQVSAATDYTIDLTITVRGTGTVARAGTSDTANAAQVTARVTDTPVAVTNRLLTEAGDVLTTEAGDPLEIE